MAFLVCVVYLYVCTVYIHFIHHRVDNLKFSDTSFRVINCQVSHLYRQQMHNRLRLQNAFLLIDINLVLIKSNDSLNCLFLLSRTYSLYQFLLSNIFQGNDFNWLLRVPRF